MRPFCPTEEPARRHKALTLTESRAHPRRSYDPDGSDKSFDASDASFDPDDMPGPPPLPLASSSLSHRTTLAARRGA